MSVGVYERTQEWTHSKFKDEFFSDLTKVPNAEIFYLDRKYYVLAKKLMYRIPIYKKKEIINNKEVFTPDPPPFIINISDLTPRVRKELKEFIELNNAKELNLLLKQIACKFFENINYEYAHDSVLSHLIVRLDV